MTSGTVAMTATTVVLILVVFLTEIHGAVFSRNRHPFTQQKKNEALAEKLSLRLMTPDHKPIHLSLKKAKVNRVPTFVGLGHDKINRWNEPHGYSLTTYNDIDSEASIVVEKRTDISGRYTTKRYRGSFAVGDQVYWISPVLRSRSGGEKADRFQPGDGSITVRIDSIDHFVSPAEFKSHDDYDNIISSSTVHQKIVKNMDESRAGRQGKAQYTVELLIVGDYSLYKYWYDTYTSFTESSRKQTETILILRHYFASVADKVNQRYASIQEPDYEIKVKLVGLFFAAKAVNSRYTQDSDVKTTYQNENYILMAKCLKKFGVWIKENAELYGPFDHAVLFVGDYLYDKFHDGVPATKSGLANVGGICKCMDGLCTSINYERGFYSSVQTGAHELAHNLGSAHDGENNNCQGKDQFIMASAPGELTDANFGNPFKFSSCSIQYMRDFLAKLTSKNDNCLQTFESTVDIEIDHQLPGVLYGADEQCYNYQGKDSFYCAGEIHDAELCQKIVCWDPEDKKCLWQSVEHRAYTGTSCGNKKWCFKGVCVADEHAGEFNVTCMYGDYRGLMYIDEQNTKITCDEMVKKFPEQCYTDDKLKRCCNACPSIKRADKPDCAYGDRSPKRCREGKAVHCYDESFKKDCCEWCESQGGGEGSTCQFGDQADWCPTATNEQCYENAELCCKSCKKHATGIEGCEFGDRVTWCGSQQLDAKSCSKGSDLGTKCCGTCSKKQFTDAGTNNVDVQTPGNGGSATCPQGDSADWCATIKPHQCYTSKAMCCSTCEKLAASAGGFSGCEYGDKANWCAGEVDKEYCQEDASVKEQCCLSCKRAMSRHSRLSLIDQLLEKLGK